MSIILTPRAPIGTAFQLPQPARMASGSLVIGRGAGVDLLIAHPLVSSRHCVVTGNGAAWQIQDSSSNGTLVNGRRVAATQPLADGDVIGLGDIEIAVRIENAGLPGVGAATQINLDDWGRPGAAVPTPSPTPMMPQPVPAAQSAQPFSATPATGTDAATQLLQAAGIDRRAVRASDEQVLAAAGAALRACLDGLAAMVQERRKARTELRVAPEAASDNPLKTLPAEAALAGLLALPPATARAAVTEACTELDRHQRATLAAMQVAFASALDQFAPQAIKLHARDDAAAWKAYEKAFNAQDGFVEVFADALGRAYARPPVGKT